MSNIEYAANFPFPKMCAYFLGHIVNECDMTIILTVLYNFIHVCVVKSQIYWNEWYD